MNRSDNHQSALIGTPQPVLLAEHASDCTKPHPCAICGRAVLRGQREAMLPGGTWAHVPCLSAP